MMLVEWLGMVGGQIAAAQVKCDLLTLDISLDNEYTSFFLSGKSQPINFSSWNHTAQQTGGSNVFSRCQSFAH
eukprot:2761041-Heterocapsa_arctica.AAC.1